MENGGVIYPKENQESNSKNEHSNDSKHINYKHSHHAHKHHQSFYEANHYKKNHHHRHKDGHRYRKNHHHSGKQSNQKIVPEENFYFPDPLSSNGIHGGKDALHSSNDTLKESILNEVNENASSEYVSEGHLEKLNEQIDFNFQDVQNKILDTFQELQTVILQRKDMLISQATMKYKEKKKTLMKFQNGSSYYNENLIPLPEGNMSFICNQEEIENVLKIGCLENSLSSPLHSYIKNIAKHEFATVGEEVRVEVITLNSMREDNICKDDKIVIEITDESCKVLKTFYFGDFHAFNSSTLMKNKKNCYTSFFTPTSDGNITINAILNHANLLKRQLIVKVLNKVSLKFSNPIEEQTKNSDISNQLSIKPKLLRNCSSESDWIVQDWVFKNGDMSSLLHSSNSKPSFIYASTCVKGRCSWKVKLTSACTEITISVGIASRCGIPDIDEEYVLTSNLASPSSKTEKRPEIRRRTSSFSTSSITYNVYLYDSQLCIVQDLSCAVTVIEIKQKKDMDNFKLYPFVSMIHHHASCGKNVCPRPQVTLL